MKLDHDLLKELTKKFFDTITIDGLDFKLFNKNKNISPDQWQNYLRSITNAFRASLFIRQININLANTDDGLLVAIVKAMLKGIEENPNFTKTYCEDKYPKKREPPIIKLSEQAQQVCLHAAKQAFEMKNYPSAFQLFLFIGKKGDVEAQTWLGYMYANGLGVVRDDARAVFFYQMAIERGAGLDALYNLAVHCAQGNGVEKDIQKAVRYFHKIISVQSATPFVRIQLDAYYALGLLTAAGEGVEKNELLAVYFYTVAAYGGHHAATHELIICYETGQGVEKNTGIAGFWRSWEKQLTSNSVENTPPVFSQQQSAELNRSMAKNPYWNINCQYRPIKDHKQTLTRNNDPLNGSYPREIKNDSSTNKLYESKEFNS